MANFHKKPEFVITSQVLLHPRTRRESPSFIARKMLGTWILNDCPKHWLHHVVEPNLYFSEISH